MAGKSKAIYRSLVDSQRTVAYDVQLPEKKQNALKTNIKTNSKPIMESGPLSKLVPFEMDFLTLRKLPISEGHVEKICKEAIDCVLNDPNCLSMDSFLFAKGISRKAWARWRDLYPVAEETDAYIRQGLGAKRELGGLKGELTASLVAAVQAHYSEVWKEQVMWRESLKQKAEDKKQDITVVIEPFPDSELVKEKK